MSDDTTADSPTPSGSPDDESTDTPTIDEPQTDAADLIAETRRKLGEAHTAAMDHLAETAGVEHELDLYQRLGFEGEHMEVTIRGFDAEIFVLVDLLDQLTNNPQNAEAFVPQARILDAMLDDLDPEAVQAWVDDPSTDADDEEAE